MEFIKKYKFVLFGIVIIIAIVSIYVIRDYRASKVIYQSKEFEEYEFIPRTYGVNEYTNVNITSEEMAKIYFNNYKIMIARDINSAYLKLDEEYRKEKLSNIDLFKARINKYNIVNAHAKKYDIINKNDYVIYVVYDENDNYYAFKTNGVMQYTVYLDDTVEIR